MKLKSVKFWNMIGIWIGIAVIILGIVLACLPADSYSTYSTDTNVKFGGDYYTYQYKASSTAAQNAGAAARNVRAIGERLALYVGLMFVVAGLLITLSYAKRYFIEEDFFDDIDFDADEFMESLYDDEELDVAMVEEIGEGEEIAETEEPVSEEIAEEVTE